ncbi:unnamed protein product [Adineta steineri]|uniref:G-protein coupled receptors family 1 profile domain-containing protein n=1 Tax=Adineta steineri TaxID=433720 RepID=A0A815TPZ3_9BILA|nr:unnamed protein product [Adineta steineri]CAF1646139.1 unnamed protein product [Adineta steineri]
MCSWSYAHGLWMYREIFSCFPSSFFLETFDPTSLYGPIAFCVIYPLLFYTVVIMTYPCQNDFDYTKYVCGGPCYQFEPGIGLFDWFCDVFGPIIVGTVATMVLIIRVILQKHRVGQRAIWQRNRKMVIQLAALSTMYIAVWIPNIISFVIPIIVPNQLALDLASNVFCYFEYFAVLLCPFVCLVGLPEVRQSIYQIFIRFNTIQPSSQNPIEFLRPLPQRAFGK